jgi:RNA polymerase sigma-70 factor, ECF subfamily
LFVLSLGQIVVEPEAASTESLLRQAQDGDAEAFGEVCRLYESRVLRQAMALCGDATMAEDLAQDTLVEAWKCLARYQGRCQFFTWLCAILLNRYRNVLRSRHAGLAWHGEAELPENRPGQPAKGEPRPDEATQEREQAELVRKCVHDLPAKHQQVVYMRFFVDDSLEGIADALGCSVGTVKSRLFHALEKLRAMKDLQSEFRRDKREERI